jgi:hypothetical protein
MSLASSSVSYGMTVTTGPDISSRGTSIFAPISAYHHGETLSAAPRQESPAAAPPSAT